VAALILALATAAGNVAVCDGWKAAPRARMACCAEGSACPMHGQGGDRAGARAQVSQETADSCCAASERDAAAPSAAYVLSPNVAAAIVTIPALDAPRMWRPPGRRFESPPLSRAIPRHLLLSVILV
jgi:hypothetical protein